MINNFLDVTIAEPLNLGAFSPLLAGQIYPIPIRSVGNTDLKETSVDAYELGYSGVVAKGRAIVSAAFYVNKIKDDIFFTEVPNSRWTASNPPPGWPLPPAVINLVPGASFPANFTYLNFGKQTQKGFELGVNSTINRYVGMFANYSYQATPEAQLRAVRAEPPAEEPLQRRRQLQPAAASWATSTSPTPTARSGRTCSTTATTARPRPTRW